jgi:tRNA nucleotidyltransferase (CCA-adding enzyme)
MVGGLPRDLALGRPGADFDLVVEGDAIALAKALAARYGGKVIAHERFGTAKWMLGESTEYRDGAGAESSAQTVIGNHLDLASARTERYRQAAQLPRVWVGSIDDDLRRRDFTINALAIRLDSSHFGRVYDHFGALDDLDHGIVRVLHHRSFRDDPTRMYRAVRYEQRYGFKISPDTVALMAAARDLVGRLSAHRIRHELDLILEEDRSGAMVRRLATLDLLRPIHPLLPSDKVVLRRLATRASWKAISLPNLSRRSLGWLLWLMDLPAREIGSVERRLHFGRELRGALLAASRLRRELADMASWRPSRVAAHLRAVAPEAVYAVGVAAPTGRAKQLCEEYLTHWRHVRPTITGHDLKERGLEPGPQFATILRDLRDAWLDGSVSNRAAERERLEALLQRAHISAKRNARAPSGHRS